MNATEQYFLVILGIHELLAHVKVKYAIFVSL